MKKKDFIEQIAINMYDMKQLKINYKYVYDKNERQEIFKIARKISRYDKEDISESRKRINEKELFDTFFNSLEIFNSDIVYDYFKNHGNRLTLIRSNKVLDDDAELAYEIRKKQPTKFYLNLPKTSLTITNQMGFAHEMGHIPEIDKPRKSYMEYFETLPMFFEYIVALKCYDKNKSKDYFSRERLNMIIDDAVSLMRLYKKCELKNNVQSLYFKQEFAESYKFLESFSFALQLVDIMEEDKEVVSKEIEQIILGKSLVAVKDDLNIETDGCQRLLKEYKRLSKEGY